VGAGRIPIVGAGRIPIVGAGRIPIVGAGRIPIVGAGRVLPAIQPPRQPGSVVICAIPPFYPDL
jgi:hypothetical protein